MMLKPRAPDWSAASPRTYRDAAGVVWRVREMQPRDQPRALYFEHDGGFRRVTDYPADWRDLPTGELEILSRET